VEDLGVRVGALRLVSHCYLRPRVPPVWRYNLFAMVHGRDREEAAGKIEAIAAMLGDACRAHEVLYSTRILKKTGVRIGAETLTAKDAKDAKDAKEDDTRNTGYGSRRK
jgi:DNA-binding Lrp family transcriptional regulator